jgi:hypothetical protein
VTYWVKHAGLNDVSTSLCGISLRDIYYRVFAIA